MVERLISWAEARDHSLLDLALSWHTSHPLVASVIAGATKPRQIAANIAAATWELDDASSRDDAVAKAVDQGLRSA